MQLILEPIKNIYKSYFHCRLIHTKLRLFQSPFDSLIANLPLSVRKLVIGLTWEAHIGLHSRNNEIAQYLRARNARDIDWISLDDSAYEFPDSCRNLIKCNPNIGLTIKECIRLNDWLRA